MTENADGPLLTRADMEYFVNHYIGSEADARNPYCSPLFAESLDGLPPALVQTAEFDPLRDEGEEYAAALEKAGNEVKMTRWDGAFHGMLSFTQVLEQSRDMLKETVGWLRRRMG
jgi:acetyl esterase